MSNSSDTIRLLTVTNTTSVTADAICQLLVKIARAAAGRPVTVFLDNARHQYCHLVRLKANELGITLKHLPVYSPNLNLIERLWKHVKKSCLTNRHYEDFASFRKAIDECMADTFKKDKKTIKSILTPNFQIIPNSQINAA